MRSQFCLRWVWEWILAKVLKWGEGGGGFFTRVLKAELVLDNCLGHKNKLLEL